MPGRDFRWWAYRHVDGSLHLKRYLSFGDLQEARQSSFVAEMFGPFLAANRESAMTRARARLLRRKPSTAAEVRAQIRHLNKSDRQKGDSDE